jgi:hypothetical protein
LATLAVVLAVAVAAAAVVVVVVTVTVVIVVAEMVVQGVFSGFLRVLFQYPECTESDDR